MVASIHLSSHSAALVTPSAAHRTAPHRTAVNRQGLGSLYLVEPLPNPASVELLVQSLAQAADAAKAIVSERINLTALRLALVALLMVVSVVAIRSSQGSSLQEGGSLTGIGSTSLASTGDVVLGGGY